MSNALFERYQKALRNGHVAVADGRLGDALVSYREAIGLAGDRPLPYTALAEVEFRLGEVERSLETSDEALELDPRHEAALRGRARALEALDRTDEAAETYDRLAESLGLVGRLSDACAAVQHAMDHRSTPARRHRLQDLTRTLRLAAGDAQTERTLGRALATSRPGLDDTEPDMSPREAARRAAAEAAEQAAAGALIGAGSREEQTLEAGDPEADAAAEPIEAEAPFVEAGPDAAAEPIEAEAPAPAFEAGPYDAAEPIEAEAPFAEASVDARAAIPERERTSIVGPNEPAGAGTPPMDGRGKLASELDADAVTRAAGEDQPASPGGPAEPPRTVAGAPVSDAGAASPAAGAGLAAPDDRPVDAAPVPTPMARPPVRSVDPEALVIAAEESAARGDVGSSVAAAMLAARIFSARDAGNAALDVCTSALAAAPANVDLHLLIAELYVSRGWNQLAGDTYQRLLRLTRLDEDMAAHVRVLDVARALLPGDPRFVA